LGSWRASVSVLVSWITDSESAFRDKTDCKIGLDEGLWATVNVMLLLIQ
jgi:hypothetical protein